jgi:predicted helicase
VARIAQGLGLRYTPEKEATPGTFAPLDLLDYIYAVLHSPAYRETYKEFLKVDFPRIPYPADAAAFGQLAGLGAQLRQLHLLQHPALDEPLASYPHPGTDRIETKIARTDWELYDAGQQLGRIWLNGTQCFEGIPLVAWQHYIGGYQPAQKWLKDRQGRSLGYDDILHYQRLIAALAHTHRLMQEVDRAIDPVLNPAG